MKKIIKLIIIILIIYSISYVIFRVNNIEVWEKDNQEYVIFPKESVWVYYFFRPASMVDAKLTGMNFHIGPHNE